MSNPSQPKITLHRKQIITAGVLVLLLITDFSFTGFLKFGYNVIRCGHTPVAVRPPAFGVGSPSYWLPGNYSPGGASTRYLCTEQDAIDQGIPRNPLQGI